MISKEKFIEIIDLMQSKMEKENIFCEALEALSGQSCNVDVAMFIDYENVVLELLTELFNDTEEKIYYFMCDVYSMSDTFRAKVIAEHPEFTNAGTLYDYLISKKGENS